MVIELQDGTYSACQPVLQQTREMLRSQLRQIEGDVIQPGPFENQIQNQTQNQLRTTQTPPVPGSAITPQRVVNTPPGDGTGQQNGNGSSNPSAGRLMPQNNTTNQDDSGQQNSGGGPMPGSGGQGGKP
jgi:hypothetical protein